VRLFARAVEIVKSSSDYVVGFVAALVPLFHSIFLTALYILYEWKVDSWQGLGQFVAGFTVGLAMRFGISLVYASGF